MLVRMQITKWFLKPFIFAHGVYKRKHEHLVHVKKKKRKMCARNATRSFSSFHIVPINDPTQPQNLLLTDLFRSALEHKSRIKGTKLRNISKSSTPRLKNANTKNWKLPQRRLKFAPEATKQRPRKIALINSLVKLPDLFEVWKARQEEDLTRQQRADFWNKIFPWIFVRATRKTHVNARFMHNRNKRNHRFKRCNFSKIIYRKVN